MYDYLPPATPSLLLIARHRRGKGSDCARPLSLLSVERSKRSDVVMVIHKEKTRQLGSGHWEEAFFGRLSGM